MADNRTEKATPRRRQKAQEKGQVLRSRELVSALTVLAVALMLAWEPEAWIGRWHAYFSRSLNAAVLSDWTGEVPVIDWTFLAVLQWVAPIFCAAFAVAITATLLQGGLVIAMDPLVPNWERLSPGRNLGQIFSVAGLGRIFRSLIPTTVILWLALRLIQKDAPAILHSSRVQPGQQLALLGSLCFGIAWQSSLVLLAWSGVDYVMQRQSYESSLKMTKEEVRQETKDADGNPQVKGRIRRLRRELFRRSLQKDVQRATAVITNPTHYAVALEYRPATMAAPVVVTKGRDHLALKIKELARWHEIPIVENPPLAQALYKAAPVGQMIPPKLYAAVAEILAFLYRAQVRMQNSGRPQKPGPDSRRGVL